MPPLFGRLRFSDELEPAYSDTYFPQALPRVRFALVLAVVLFALFGILDAFIVPDRAGWIWFIRYALVCPAGLAGLGLTYMRSFRTIMQPALAAYGVFCGSAIVAMITIVGPFGGYLYYAGLLLVIFWIFTLMQLRFSYAAGSCLLIVLGYEIVAIWVKDTPVEILLSNNFFFLSAAILGAAAGYTIEHGKRTGFLQRRVIERQRAELAEHNIELDTALRESLDEVRRQAGELRASRARIVVAGDVERRRIERNLHDGCQQQLVALSATLNVAEMSAQDGEQRILFTQLKRQAQEALDDLRDLARGIYPPLLADQGLVAALESQARKAPLPVDVEAEGVGRYPSEVEAAVYFSVLEALQNVAKYANATKASVALSAPDGALAFEVVDDGVGFDPRTTSRGIGLQSMVDRLEALGGSLAVGSEPGHGTTITGSVPGAVTQEAAR